MIGGFRLRKMDGSEVVARIISKDMRARVMAQQSDGALTIFFRLPETVIFSPGQEYMMYVLGEEVALCVMEHERA